MSTEALENKRVHREAFTLMWYVCQCEHRECVWNSRDGVTPFIIGCPSCGKPTLTHDSWNLDCYMPDHQPHRGQRYFRDGTPAEAREIMRRRIERLREDFPLAEQDEARFLQEAESGDRQEFQQGWPMIETA